MVRSPCLCLSVNVSKLNNFAFCLSLIKLRDVFLIANDRRRRSSEISLIEPTSGEIIDDSSGWRWLVLPRRDLVANVVDCKVKRSVRNRVSFVIVLYMCI